MARSMPDRGFNHAIQPHVLRFPLVWTAMNLQAWSGRAAQTMGILVSHDARRDSHGSPGYLPFKNLWLPTIAWSGQSLAILNEGYLLGLDADGTVCWGPSPRIHGAELVAEPTIASRFCSVAWWRTGVAGERAIRDLRDAHGEPLLGGHLRLHGEGESFHAPIETGTWPLRGDLSSPLERELRMES